ncbi:MAG: putative secreted protein [Acidimicrobiales bacterium]|nr:putative secreted protein [Acidimicrobiales bacterium]
MRGRPRHPGPSLHRAVILATVLLAAIATAKPAWAENPDMYVAAHGTPGGATIVVETHTKVAAAGSAPASRHAAGSEFVSCDTRAPGGLAYLDHLVSSNQLGEARPQPGTTEILHHHCVRADGSSADWFSTPAPAAPAASAAVPSPPSALDLARRAAASLRPPPPLVRTSPAGPQLVGFPTWFWVEGWSPLTKASEVPGLRSVVTATPVATRYAFDDGGTLHCQGPGTPWRRGGGAGQHSDCTHTFTHHGRRQVEATASWLLTWTASDGQSGTLPSVDPSRTLSLEVQEAQAIID